MSGGCRNKFKGIARYMYGWIKINIRFAVDFRFRNSDNTENMHISSPYVNGPENLPSYDGYIIREF